MNHAMNQSPLAGIEFSLETEKLLTQGRYEEWRKKCHEAAAKFPDHSIAIFSTRRITHPVADGATVGVDIESFIITESGYIATAHLGGEMAIWENLNSLSPLFRAHLGNDTVHLCEAPDGGVMAACQDRIFQWLPHESNLISTAFVDIESDISSMVGDTAKVFVGSYSGDIYEFLPTEQRWVWHSQTGNARVADLAITQDGALYSCDWHGMLRCHGLCSSPSDKSHNTAGIAVLGGDRFVTTSGRSGLDEMKLWHDTEPVRTVASGLAAGDAVAAGPDGTFFGGRQFGHIVQYSPEGDAVRTMSTDMESITSLGMSPTGSLMVAGSHGVGYLDLSASGGLPHNDPSLDFISPAPVHLDPMTVIAASEFSPIILRWTPDSGPQWERIEDSPNQNNTTNIAALGGGELLLQRYSKEGCFAETVVLDMSLTARRSVNLQGCYSILPLRDRQLLANLGNALYLQQIDSREPAKRLIDCSEPILMELHDGRILCAEFSFCCRSTNRLLLMDLNAPQEALTLATLPEPATGLAMAPDGTVHIFLDDDSVLTWDPANPSGGVKASHDVDALSLASEPTRAALEYKTSGMDCCTIQLPGGHIGMAQGRRHGLTIWAPASYASRL